MFKNASGVFVVGALNAARVVQADITGGGSVVHVVDALLLPPSLQGLLPGGSSGANSTDSTSAGLPVTVKTGQSSEVVGGKGGGASVSGSGSASSGGSGGASFTAGYKRRA